MTRCRVDAPRAVGSGNIGGQNTRNLAFQKRMLESDPVKFLARNPGQDIRHRQSAGFLHRPVTAAFHQQDITLTVRDGEVGELGMERHGHAGRKRPRGCRPDEDEHLAALQCRVELGGVIKEGVFDVNRRASPLLVFDFRLCQGRLAGDAVVDRLQAAIYITLLEELDKSLGNRRLIVGLHGQIRLVPLPQHSQAFESLPLDFHIFLRIPAAAKPELHLAHLRFLSSELLVNFDLDGKPVAVPARTIGSIEARHGFCPDDEILDHLVEGRTQVNLTVGIRGTIMESVSRGVLAHLTNPGIEAARFPFFKHFGLVLRQVRLHREGRARQIERIFQILRFSHYFSRGTIIGTSQNRVQSGATNCHLRLGLVWQ